MLKEENVENILKQYDNLVFYSKAVRHTWVAQMGSADEAWRWR